MKIPFVIFIIVLGLGMKSAVAAQNESQYAGQEQREIKSLSESDLAELRAGKGWGLAKAAELNGYPGPVHLIQLKQEIELTDAQLAGIERLYADMKQKAVPLGLKLIELEKRLDVAFADKTISEETLAKLLEDIEGVRTDLRYVHLSFHLKTPAILTKAQVEKYNRLRGYSSKDPCANVPEGHDPAMWKRHNGCGE